MDDINHDEVSAEEAADCSADINYDSITPVVESVASDMSRRYGQYGADRADISQECWLWIFLHPEKVVEFLDNGDYGVKQLAKTLRNEAQDYGESVKAQHLGYSLDDLYHYRKDEVRMLLDAVFDEEAWTEPPVSEEGPTGRRDPATGGGWIATLTDVSQAFDRLQEKDRDLLIAFHREGWTNKMLADSAGVTEQTMSYRHDSAVRRLVDKLGGPRPRPQHDEDCSHVWRNRHALSNTTARAIQQQNYEE
ncbi:MAG: Sigma-70 family polymerase sigma factor [Nocardioides sp.]|nr:Sigma-70 family polymerase sigma factor [Nocardioides sp.]